MQLLSYMVNRMFYTMCHCTDTDPLFLSCKEIDQMFNSGTDADVETLKRLYNIFIGALPEQDYPHGYTGITEPISRVWTDTLLESIDLAFVTNFPKGTDIGINSTQYFDRLDLYIEDVLAAIKECQHAADNDMSLQYE